PGTARPLKFLRTVIFLKIKRDGNEKFLWQDHQNRQLTLMS
ncbi:terminase, partial [Salmonella enterica subsp. enterica serovar Kentucky]|nr:terminase [Salmonella enterica subsp. enterica serovar Kentucky]